MNRAQATLAAQRGLRLERVAGPSDTENRAVRWDPTAGFQIQTGSGKWVAESGSAEDEYYECVVPRTFLGVWQEVATFAEAEPAGQDGGAPVALATDGKLLLRVCDCGRVTGPWFYVRRIEKAGDK